MGHGHFLIVSFPLQGQVNPSLQLAKQLLRIGVDVTFASTVSSLDRIDKGNVPAGLAFSTFSDGSDDGIKEGDAATAESYVAEIERRGSQALTRVIQDCAAEGRPVTRLIYTTLVQWAIGLARGCHVPSALLWTQPATVLDICYFYFYGYGDVIKNNWASGTIKLPGLPPLTGRDLPTPMHPQRELLHLLSPLQGLLAAALDEDDKPKILVNTFDALEPEAIRAVDRIEVIAIGPFAPWVSHRNDSSHTDQWLNSQRESSVVYVSFGSIAVLSKGQLEEVARGLLESGRPFLWVIRAREEAEDLSCAAELARKGMIVRWCSQAAVLAHAAVGCFVTHFGWNSTAESLAAGVPSVGLPQWMEQTTNAKLIEDVWRTGVRTVADEEGVVAGEEIARCVEMVMGDGERGEEMRRNARKWKELARDAVREGGSSDKNLRRFVEEFRGGRSVS